MTTIKTDWEDEAKKWNEDGDPAADSSLSVALEWKKIAEKQIAHREVLDAIDAMAGRLCEELIGIDLTKVAVGTGAGLGIGAFIERIRREKGEEAAKEMAEVIAEEMGVQTSEILDPSGRYHKFRPNWKQFLPKLMKRLGAKIAGAVAGGGAVLALLELGTLITYFKELWELEDQDGVLRRALRYEALRLDPEVDPDEYTCFFVPDQVTRKCMEGPPPCILFVTLTYRWIDSTTGKTEIREMGEVEVDEYNEDKHAWEKKFTAQLPDTVCFAEAIIKWTLHCPTDPPKVKELTTVRLPIRTSGDCSRHRGNLPG